MESKVCDLYRGGAEFKFLIEPDMKSDAPPGLYMFPAGCGDTYVLLQGRQAVLIDSGVSTEAFANFCWNPFFLRHVDTFAAVVSHVDKDHIAGLRALTTEESFGKEGPKLTALW